MKDDYTTYSHYHTYTLLFSPFTPKGVINFKFPLQPHQRYYITQFGEPVFVSITQNGIDER